jgi:hypothetical protein
MVGYSTCMAAPDTGMAAVGMGIGMVFEAGWPAAAVAVGAVFQAEGVGKFLLVSVERKKPQSLC